MCETSNLPRMENLLPADLEALKQIFTAERLFSVTRAALVMVIAVLVTPLVRRAVTKAFGAHPRPQQVMLARRAVTYVLYGLALAASLRELGFELGVLLGAAGVMTVALGFAAQTSVSNLISGLFLIGEQPFVVGDTITVDKITGEILSIDLLSLKLRTADNLYVRVPNETMLKSIVVNMTRFATRRLDIDITVGIKEDVARVRDILLEAAKNHPLCLNDPKPALTFTGYSAQGTRMLLAVWAQRENIGTLQDGLNNTIKTAFEKNGVELPKPILLS